MLLPRLLELRSHRRCQFSDRWLSAVAATHAIAVPDRSLVLLDGNKHCPLNVDGAADVLGHDFHGRPDAVLVLRDSSRAPQVPHRMHTSS